MKSCVATGKCAINLFVSRVKNATTKPRYTKVLQCKKAYKNVVQLSFFIAATMRAL